jgi:hypothetical protein
VPAEVYEAQVADEVQLRLGGHPGRVAGHTFPRAPAAQSDRHLPGGIGSGSSCVMPTSCSRSRGAPRPLSEPPVADSPVSRTLLLDYGASGMTPRA